MASVELVILDPMEEDEEKAEKSLGTYEVGEFQQGEVLVSDFYGSASKVLGPNSSKVVIRLNGLVPAEPASKKKAADTSDAKAEPEPASKK